MKKKQIPYCSVHTRYQNSQGDWLSVGCSEHFETITKEDERMESPCDFCDDPGQILIEFEEIKPDYSGMRGNNSLDK